MEVPVQIDFQGMNAEEKVRGTVLKHVAVLDQRFGRITACRVVIKAPSDRHRTGGLYEINIRLSLPQGREVDIGRTATADERHADLAFAMNDAFKRARRRLRDQSRRIRGDVKLHEAQPTATVTRVDDKGEFGFLETSDGREIYFHRNSVLSGSLHQFAPGTRVTFCEEAGEKGPQASTVKLLGKHALR